MLQIFLFTSYILIKEINSQKVIFTFKSRQTQQQQKQYLHHFSKAKAYLYPNELREVSIIAQ